MEKFKNYINGQWVDAVSGKVFQNINPANQEDIIGEFALSAQADVDNAVEAAPSEGGIISFTAEKTSVDENLFFKETELSPGNYVLIRIRDNGEGIDTGESNRIFDPYYTTKPDSEGLGLAMSYAIIKKHRGFIKAEFEKSAGTVLSIYLPVF